MAAGSYTVIQSDPSIASAYANSIVGGYNAVGKDKATKDGVSEYAASGTISALIDNEYSSSEEAAEQAVDFVQVLHGIHMEFQTTDARIANSINRGNNAAETGSAGSAGKKKNAKLFSQGTN
ncbi:TIGR04197 family type VII secretion effector [Streptococcus panodentis]|uniref:TIGR04197 family type VII secretion effector n=1 Tax=Streptococcus panodentis TaxID=1581472 RepID=A0ABS5B057_9STRE|nr:TIGR04197 family type VII secretion effector [Streptococcus panodentis]MBP2622217.1 hypothetical protein [Streptococcus panodentis]